MTVLAYDPFIDAAYAETHHAELVNELENLLKNSDYVTIHTPLTSLTKNMIDEEALRKMKPDAIIINTARGGIIDETALYDALKNNSIRGAGLDVFVKEPPLPDKNPLLTLMAGSASTGENQPKSCWPKMTRRSESPSPPPG